MNPRPRNTANKHLPQNLYFDTRRSTYRYRRPTDGKWFQFGTDRIKAIEAAKQLNLAFMQGADLVRSVMGSPSGTFAGFLDKYETEILPPRELAKGTLELYAVHFRRFRKYFTGKGIDEISIRMIAELLDSLTPQNGQPMPCLTDRHLQPRSLQRPLPGQPGIKHHHPHREEKAQAPHPRRAQSHPPSSASLAAQCHSPGTDLRTTTYRHPGHAL